MAEPKHKLPEEEEVRRLVGGVRETVSAGGNALEVASERLSELVRRYCESPVLLEPLVAQLLPGLAILALENPTSSVGRAAFLYAYHLIRARGYKLAVVHLPHEVSYLKPVLEALEAEDPQDKVNWHSRFVLLLWLSIVVMMPFHMSLLDGDKKEGTSKTVAMRIFELCKSHSLVTDTCSLADAFLTSKFLTRSDILENHLGEYFEWCRKQNANLRDEDTIKYGVLCTAATVLKHGKREDLLPYTDELFHWVAGQNYQANKSITVRKYAIKIVQRIGLILLKPRLATWRYIRETSSLALNLQAKNDKSSSGDHNVTFLSVKNETDNSDDQEIPEQIEDIIEHLFMGLRDGDNIVRWSAAKGTGRVAARLNCSAAGDIISGIMDLFNPHEGDGAWHGGCLALAELGRRGLLLKQHLQDAINVVLQALQYEEVRGHTPTGSHVRDAACYVCWAFVRAYSEDLNPYINELVIGLMITAVFDREINCRLAARAAFEESVGRLQIINRENLSILTADDFYLSSTKKAYLSAAPYICSVNKKYVKPLIDHLTRKKINHWDMNIRELAAKSLHLLTKESPVYIAENILPELVQKSSSSDLNTRHGSISALGEVVYALKLNGITVLSDSVFDEIQNLVPLLKSRYQFRGLGGELMRQACCVCIESLSLAKIKFHGQPIIDDWLELIEECLSHDVNTIRSKAIPALATVFNEYLNDDFILNQSDGIRKASQSNIVGEITHDSNLIEKRGLLLNKYCELLKAVGSNGIQTRMGHSLALGEMPCFALKEHLPNIISSLISCCEITEPTLKWAESRRDAIKGLTSVCKTVGINNIENSSNVYNCNTLAIFECFLTCLGEYTIEKRGDIGALVREASMAGLLSLCKQCAEEKVEIFSPELVTRIMVGIAQQAVEKIDRTRALAGKTFTSLLYCSPPMPYIPHHSELCDLFPYSLVTDTKVKPSNEDTLYSTIKDDESKNKSAVLWLFPKHTMPLFIKMLDWEVYRYKIVLGITVSGGEMMESLVKHTTSALFSYMTTLYDNKTMMKAICDTIIQVFSDHQNIDRIVIPMLKFLDRLLSSGCINLILEDPESDFADKILELVKIEMKDLKNIYKFLDGITVLCQIIQVGGEVCRKSLKKLSIHLCSANKYIRKSTASKLYDSLLIYGDSMPVDPENMDQVMTVLAETNWELEVAELKPIRNNLCTLLDIPAPVLLKK